jgi:hypothetical protein
MSKKIQPSPSVTKDVQLLLSQFRLEDVPSHLLRRAHFKAEEIFATTFAEEGVTPRQKAALVLLHQEPGLNQNSLAERLSMDRNTVAEMVRRMSTSGLVERRPSPGDARAYQLFVAPGGIPWAVRQVPEIDCRRWRQRRKFARRLAASPLSGAQGPQPFATWRSDRRCAVRRCPPPAAIDRQHRRPDGISPAPARCVPTPRAAPPSSPSGRAPASAPPGPWVLPTTG